MQRVSATWPDQLDFSAMNTTDSVHVERTSWVVGVTSVPRTSTTSQQAVSVCIRS